MSVRGGAADKSRDALGSHDNRGTNWGNKRGRGN